MLSAARSLSLNIESAPPLPRVEELESLYRLGVQPRQGQLIMIAGRSGCGKSSFALWWSTQMNLDTLYLSADMSGYTASIKLACMQLGVEERVAEEMWKRPEGRQEILDALEPLNTTFSFGQPITWWAVDEEIEAYVELHDKYPDLIVFDNLMDIEGCESGYAEQMAAMQSLSDLTRFTGSTVIVLHHASDGQGEGHGDPFAPPARFQIKNKLGEKPELTLTVGLNPRDQCFKIAPVKNRMGFQDLTGNTVAHLRAIPEHTRYRKWVQPQRHGFAPQL